jgi:hypothetical protein
MDDWLKAEKELMQLANAPLPGVRESARAASRQPASTTVSKPARGRIAPSD